MLGKEFVIYYKIVAKHYGKVMMQHAFTVALSALNLSVCKGIVYACLLINQRTILGVLCTQLRVLSRI